jgi:hypothetical protein
MARTSSGQLKVGLVGKRACAFVAGFRSMPQTRITALCELDRALLDTLAERYAIPERYSDYEELLERGRPDIVVLGTPMHLHVPQAVAALARHIHVLSEVTAAVSLEQCRELVRAVRASRATYMMAENYCYMGRWLNTPARTPPNSLAITNYPSPLCVEEHRWTEPVAGGAFRPGTQAASAPVLRPGCAVCRRQLRALRPGCALCRRQLLS